MTKTLSLNHKTLNLIIKLIITLVGGKISMGCLPANSKTHESTLNILDDWQILDQKIPPIGPCTEDEIVAQILRKMIEKDAKTFTSQQFRNLLYAELKSLLEKRPGIRSLDITSIMRKVVSTKGKPNPYMVRDLGYSPDQIFLPLGELARYLEEETRFGRFDDVKNRALLGFLSAVTLRNESAIDRALIESLEIKFPNVSWDRTVVRHFHLMELTHLFVERLRKEEADQLLDKIKYLSKLRSLLIQVQDTVALSKLGQILPSLKQVRSLYLTKSSFWGQFNLGHVTLLALDKSPHITTFGFSSDLGFIHDQERSTVDWSTITQWKNLLTHVKTLVYVDGHTYNSEGLPKRSEQTQILKAIGQIKKFDTFEILELTGDTFTQLPPPDLRIHADQVRIRSHYFNKTIHPPKTMPTLNLDVLKCIFSTARSMTVEKVFLQTGRPIQASNDWEELHLLSSQPYSMGFTPKNTFTIVADPLKDRALKKISLENSPLFKVSEESEHLFKVRRTPVLSLVYHWNETRERLDQDAEFLLKNLLEGSPSKP